MGLELIVNPAKTHLDALQDVLHKKRDVISDIWAQKNPFIRKVIYILALVDGQPAGVATLNIGEVCGEIHKLYVAPDFKLRGVGRALFLKAIEVLREEKMEEFHLDIHGGVAFWNKVLPGLKVVSESGAGSYFFQL
jgi:GNAT superfamily N-acetyltransferase